MACGCCNFKTAYAKSLEIHNKAYHNSSYKAEMPLEEEKSKEEVAKVMEELTFDVMS